jgi:Na+-transporting methylmalonyl-CoA/oxaloacetate decarboxylase gamma subunit
VSLIEQGLIISVLGLTLTFLALGLLILIIVVLQRLFSAPTSAPAVESTVFTNKAIESDDELAAAVAAAVLLMRASARRGASRLGHGLEIGPGRWWQPLPASQAPRKRQGDDGRDIA